MAWMYVSWWHRKDATSEIRALFDEYMQQVLDKPGDFHPQDGSLLRNLHDASKTRPDRCREKAKNEDGHIEHRKLVRWGVTGPMGAGDFCFLPFEQFNWRHSFNAWKAKANHNHNDEGLIEGAVPIIT